MELRYQTLSCQYSLILFENLTKENQKVSGVKCWELSVHPGTYRKKKSLMENSSEEAKEVKSPAHKLEIIFSSLESAFRHTWNNCGIIALYTIYLY